MFSRSRLVVGSSKARMPQFKQNVSARARRMMREANTWKKAPGLSRAAQTFSPLPEESGEQAYSLQVGQVMGSPALGGESLLFGSESRHWLPQDPHTLPKGEASGASPQPTIRNKMKC